MFTEQTVFCNGCGKPFETTFHVHGGHVCGSECRDIVEQKKTASMLGNGDEVDHSLSDKVATIFAQSNRTSEALDQYRKTLNRIDDFFEYANESKKDREFIHMQLDALNERLLKIYNE